MPGRDLTGDSAESVRFGLEWERGDSIRSPELAATWARLEVWVDDICVTQVEDVDNGSARRSIYVAAYPLAEWMAFNWWHLRANVRPAAFPSHVFAQLDRPRLRPWLRTHNLRGVGDGYVWPNLTVLPEGPATRLVWHADRARRRNAPIRYLSSGEALIDSFVLERAMADFIETVITRLDEQGIEEAALRDEWDAVVEADEEEVEFCVAASRLGLDPYSVPADVGDALADVDRSLDRTLLHAFLEGVSPSAIREGLKWVTESAAEISATTAGPGEVLKALRSVGGLDGGARGLPWDRGWSQANDVRRFLGLGTDTLFKTTDTFTVIHRDSNARHLQGVGGFGPNGGGGLVVARELEPRDQRFAQARALWHALGPEPDSRFLLTSSPAYWARVERAFAAELLAPAAGIDEMVAHSGDDVVTIGELDDVADHFAVNPLVIRHQVENQLGLPVAA